MLPTDRARTWRRDLVKTSCATAPSVLHRMVGRALRPIACGLRRVSRNSLHVRPGVFGHGLSE